MFLIKSHASLLKNIGIDFVSRWRCLKILTFAVAIVVIGAVFQFGPIKIEEARAAAGGVKNNPKFI
jgi:hypothetical protein